MSRACKRLAVGAGLVSLVWHGVGAWAAMPRPVESAVLAEYVASLVGFVRWPPPTGGEPVRQRCVIGVVNDKELAQQLRQLSARLKADPPVEVRSFEGMLEFRGQETPGRRQEDLLRKKQRKREAARQCTVLFLGRAEDRWVPWWIDALDGAPVLTVGETREFIRRGGMVAFVAMQPQVEIEISLTTAERAGLEISPKLLRMARVMKDPGGQPP